MQPTKPTPSPIMGQALNQQQQPQEQTPSIDPQLSKSIIDNLKDQSSQIEQAQGQLEDQNSIQAQQANQALKQKQATISRALGQLNDKSTQGQVGQAMGDGSSNWANLCEAYAEQQTLGHQGVYPTAYAAYQDQASKGNISTSTDNIPKGAQIFMAPNSGNGYNGHTMVSIGNGKFQGPLPNGSIGTFTLDQWLNYSGQSFLGWSKAK